MQNRYCNNLSDLERNLLTLNDNQITDLINLFLDEEFSKYGVITENDLLEEEKSRNSLDGDFIKDCGNLGEEGVKISIEEIKNRYCFIWKNHEFIESLDMDFVTQQFFMKLRDSIESPDEMLFWTFRFCAYGGYDNPLPYTLYKGLMNGRFSPYYDSYKLFLKFFAKNDDVKNDIVTCEEVIETIEELEDGAIITTDENRYVIVSTHQHWGNKENCFGVYLTSDRHTWDLSFLKGAILKGIYLSENPVWDEPWERDKIFAETSLMHPTFEYIVYINFQTNRGILQCVLYDSNYADNEMDIKILKNDCIISHIKEC